MTAATVIRADARCLPIADSTVDLIVTSPPYFALRSYQDGGEHYAGQVGAEATPAEFVDTLIDCTREWLRVLKPSGSLWVNLGDKYGQSASQWQGSRRGHCGDLAGTKADAASRFGQSTWDDAPALGRPKSLIGIPWRYALRCIDELGLILRAEVIWSKPNGLPESVTDRVRRSHEQWFHFTMQPRYFSAVDEIREGYAPATAARYTLGYKSNTRTEAGQQSTPSVPLGVADLATNPLGKLPGSVWTVATEPLNVPQELGVDHFAAFPTEWPRRIIQGWSPAGVCVECCEGRRPVMTGGGLTPEGESLLARRGVHADQTYMARSGRKDAGWGLSHNISGTERQRLAAGYTIIGYACACPEPTARARPAVVLDPFGGTGTTALVASVLGRLGVSVDLSSDYCRLARWRTTDPSERARAMRVEKPPKQTDGQLDLLGEAS